MPPEDAPHPADVETRGLGRPVGDRDDMLVAQELRRERARRLARAQLDAEARPPVVVPDFMSLRDALAHPTPSVQWRIDGWQPAGSRVIVAAQFKAGKTTLIGNLARTLLDGDPWLGRDAVTPLTGTLAILDFEMSPSKLTDWLAAQRIQHDDRVLVLPMRGQASIFNILDDTIRAQWATRLSDGKAEYLILDCLRPVLDSLGLDEHHDAGRFLVAFDALLREAGINDALVVHHMGHANERSRGDSRLRDWPDVEWRLVRADDDPSSPRYLTAYGRDVDQPETALRFDGQTRRLLIVGGSRVNAKRAAALDAIVTVLTDAGTPMNGTAIKKALEGSGHHRDTIDGALRLGLNEKRLSVEPGKRNAKLYRVSLRASGNFRSVSDGDTPGAASELPDDYRESEAREAPELPLDGHHTEDVDSLILSPSPGPNAIGGR